MRRALFGFASVLAVAAATGFDATPAVAADMDEDCRKAIHGKFYAQANRAILFAETTANGVKSEDVFLVDNDNSSSRFGFKGKGWIDCSWYAGMQIELETESNPSNDVEFGQSILGGDTDAGDDSGALTTGGGEQFELKERVIDAYIGNKGIGKLSLGQGKHASDGTTEADLSKTTVISSVDQSDFMGDLAYGSGGAGFSGIDINDLQNGYDGLSREDRIRLDSAEFAGFMASTSYNDSDEWDVALRFARKFDGTKVKAAVHYAESNTGAGRGREFEHSLGGSISVLFPMGLNFTFAAAEREWETSAGAPAAGFTGRYFYGKVGWIFDNSLFPWEGWTAIAADVQFQEDHEDIVDNGVCGGANNCDVTSYGAYLVHSPLKGVEVYLGGRVHDADVTLIQTDEVWGLMSGIRVKM